ncbi:glycosyltransferase family 2 protein [Celeribacter indicus]|uniref:Family 2 glycosyl transferase n=1 Tax=Celeribacter indicus TaxID=1208324 RepID=A0A0B5DXR6_9RHOB|nr:glycosyltransferase family 2 protein [Celeribacter indicus]AJE47794.1 family 2 glycosyl transferase [Celeribacter indicus]SDW23110.1 Glycosyl transferase family 2 [Celeribacter indicus]
MGHTITAIVPTFNRGAMLAETLTGILRQKRPVDQIIVQDDGSTDETPEIVAPLVAAEGHRLHYERTENGGKSRALNRALSKATGDYIWICDDDDIALPEATAKLAAHLDADPTLGVVAGRHERFSTRPDGKPVLDGTGYWPDLSRGSALRHTLEDIFFFQNATLVRRDCYDCVGPFDETLTRSIDYEMTVRLLARFPAQVIEDVIFLQRKHDGARGPAGQQHAAARSEEVWRETDREIFARFRHDLPLSLYEAMFETGDPGRRRRAALLERGAVYARRRDWEAALEDFEAAARLAPACDLSVEEARIAVRAMAAKHGADEVFAPERRRSLRRIARSGRAGRSLTRWLGRGALWRLRAAVEARQAREAMRIAAFLAAVPPATDPIPETADPALRERDTLPLEAYAW